MRKTFYLAGLAVLVFLGGAAINELDPPQIQSVPVPGDDPLTLRFAVSNRGFLTTIRDLDFTCVPDRIAGKGANGATLSMRGEPFPLNVKLDLGPGASFQYTCPLGGPMNGAPPPGPVNRIEAHVEAAYTRFGQRKHTRSGALTWDAQSRVWVDGR